MMVSRPRMLVLALVALGLSVPAAAQFDPAFNHLKCYQIKDKPVTKTIVVDTQFGRERIVKLTPVLICAPAKKTCCANPPTVAGCQPIACPPDPTNNQPAPVDHFKCYKIGVKTCTDAAGTPVDCSTVTKFAKGTVQLNLHDQFGDETVFLGAPKLLCAPVLKTVVGQTTSTSTTTTTIVQPTTTTTTTIPCHNTSQPGTPAVCAGDCPPGTGLACVYIPALNDCRCEIPCAQNGGTCNMQFCPNQLQQCCTNAVIPCGCGGLPGAPCSAPSDCCSGTCMVPPGTCQ